VSGRRDTRKASVNLLTEARGTRLPANRPIPPIDLNDGNVSHRPPLAECLGYVRRVEFMILLLGDTYGSLAPKAR